MNKNKKMNKRKRKKIRVNLLKNNKAKNRKIKKISFHFKKRIVFDFFDKMIKLTFFLHNRKMQGFLVT
jgi:hypothetical protein